MNMPNFLTLLRIILSPVFMFFFMIENFYMKLVGLILFVIAALTDLADGYYARKYGVVTGFGKFMDPLADKILVSSALITFVALEYVSAIPVILIVGREFLITGLRLLAAYKGVVIPPSWGAKVKTFMQMTVVGIAMAYISLLVALQYFDSPALEFFSFDYRLYLDIAMWATAVITVWSGLDYGIKYFYMIRSVLR